MSNPAKGDIKTTPAKAVVPAVLTVLYAVQAALSDGTIVAEEWIAIATGILAVIGVFYVKNKPVQKDTV